MTRGSIQEYTEAVKGRYLRASKKEKGRSLDEFTQVIGYHRKAVVRLLHRGKSPRSVKHRGRPRRYGPEVAEAVRMVWEATDRLCSKRLRLPLTGYLVCNIGHIPLPPRWHKMNALAHRLQLTQKFYRDLQAPLHHLVSR